MPTPIRVLLKFAPRKPFKCKREEVGKSHHVLAKWTWSCSICTPPRTCTVTNNHKPWQEIQWILHWSGPWFQSKIMVQINNTVYPRNVQQKHQIWSFNNFCKNMTCTQQAAVSFSPVALLGRFCGPSMACPFLQRDSMAAQATQGH